MFALAKPFKAIGFKATNPALQCTAIFTQEFCYLLATHTITHKKDRM